MPLAALNLIALPDIPLVRAGDDLADLIMTAMRNAGLAFAAGDVVVVAQKIVSKAEGRCVSLEDVVVSDHARALAEELGKDPKLVELILSESRRVVRAVPGLLIVEHRLGFIMANAGIDQSNIGPPEASPQALLLPRDPDASAAKLAAALGREANVAPAVVINDSFGRPWRRGTVGVALGAHGLPSVADLRGQPDLYGRKLQASVVALADEIASAASLLMGQADEARPVVLMRGLTLTEPASPASALLRDAQEDQFR